jgi:hypothetical protein
LQHVSLGHWKPAFAAKISGAKTRSILLKWNATGHGVLSNSLFLEFYCEELLSIEEKIEICL